MHKLSALFFVAGLALVLGAALARGGLAVFTGQASVTGNAFVTAPCFPNANTGFLDPSAEAADGGGDGNGFEVNPTYAFGDDSLYAENNNGAGDRHRYYDYGISIDSSCAISGIEVRLDWFLDSTFGSNSMDVELSWDSGASWTAAKTDTTETTTEHTATLGGSTDNWGHAWTAGELSDANFRIRVTSNSQWSSRDFFLEWVPVKVYYGPPGPTSTPTPGPSPTPTMTPTPGPSPTPTITPTPTPTPPPCSPGDTGFLDPSAQAADTGGDGDGFEVNPTNAFADAGTDPTYKAENINGAGDRHRYYDYGFSIGSGCIISGIEVRLDWFLDSTNWTSTMGVELSWDGGTSWTVARTDPLETTTEHTAILGGPTDTWGRSWTPTELGDANFRVRLTSNSTNNVRDFYLDWVPVKVYYGP